MGSIFKKKSESEFCEQGNSLLRRGQLREALETYNTGIRKYPQSFSLYANRANIWIQTENFPEAISDMSESLRHWPADKHGRWSMHLNRGTCYVRTGQDALAARDFEKGFREAPTDASPVILAKGYFYRSLLTAESNPKKSLADAKEAVRLEPTNLKYQKLMRDLSLVNLSPEAQALGREGAAHLQAGRFEEALTNFEAFLKLEPESAKGWQLKGAALHKMKRFPEEIQALDRSFELDGNEVALFNRAMCHLALENPSDARQDLVLFLNIGTHGPTLAQAEELLRSLSEV